MAAGNWCKAGLALCGLIVGACSADPPAEAPQYTPAVPQTPAQTTPTAQESLRTVVDAVLADAATRSGRPVGELEVVSAESVTWSDGSLGCPQPGMMYTQALVPGYRIRIRAGEREIDYHAGRNGHFAICPQGQAIEPIRRDDAI